MMRMEHYKPYIDLRSNAGKSEVLPHMVNDRLQLVPTWFNRTID